MKTKKGLNKTIESKSHHHFVQRLLVPYVRQQVAKSQVLMRSQQNCLKQDDWRRDNTEQNAQNFWQSVKL